MKIVLKWDVPADDRPHEIGGGRVVHVACQSGPGVVQVWTEEWDKNSLPYPKRTAYVVGTGQPFDESGTVVGTVVEPVNGRWLVWHVVRV